MREICGKTCRDNLLKEVIGGRWRTIWKILEIQWYRQAVEGKTGPSQKVAATWAGKFFERSDPPITKRSGDMVYTSVLDQSSRTSPF